MKDEDFCSQRRNKVDGEGKMCYSEGRNNQGKQWRAKRPNSASWEVNAAQTFLSAIQVTDGPFVK